LNLALWKRGGPPALPQTAAHQQAHLNGLSRLSTVVLQGSQPLTWQWRRDGVPLADGGNIFGSNQQALIINPVTMPDASLFDVVVTNACGSAIGGPTTLEIGPPCAGDISPTNGGDNVVNIDDLLQALLAWGPCSSPLCLGDTDHNGIVNIDDLLAVITTWGPCP
jgi:hypothetical protein